MKAVIQIAGRVCAALAMVMVIMLATGCEELLDEALQKEIAVEQEIFNDETATADVENVEVSPSVQLGAAGKLGKTMDGSHAIAVTVEDVALFSWIMGEGGGSLQGAVQNNDSYPAVFKVYIGVSSDIGSSVEIGSITVAAGQSTNFSFQGTALESYFQSHFSAGTEGFYVILYGESDSVNLWISNLEFVLQPGAVIRTGIGPSSDYSEYADTIEDITDISLSGSIRNNGVSPVTLLFRAVPETPSTEFTGFSVSTDIAAGTTFNLSDWHTLFDAATLAEMGDAIEYLASGAIVAELFFTSETAVNVTVVSVVLMGSVSVGL